MIGVCGKPPCPWKLQALLSDVAVCALDLSRTDRQIIGQRMLIVDLMQPFGQIPVALAHRRVDIGDAWRFKMGRERLDDLLGTPGLEPFFVIVHPGLALLWGWGEGFGCRTQVFAHMKEVDQVAALRSKSLFHLIGDPRRPVSYGVDSTVAAKAGGSGTSKQILTSFQTSFLPLRLSFCAASGSTVGTMPPSIWAIRSSCPVCVGHASSRSTASNMAFACPSLMRRMVLSASTTP